ncbi:unnamed protein product [Auanema sp. JU1783]|nr:unnamed protein product [Auanema sp. JU1783]
MELAPHVQGESFLDRPEDNPKELWTYQKSDNWGSYKVSGCDPAPNDAKYSFPITSMPKTVMRTIFMFLKLVDCYSFLKAVPHPMIEELLVEKKEILYKALTFSDNFYWSRDVGKYEWDRIANRVGHSMTYLPSENAVYIFGGRNIDEENRPGLDNTFNDMWKLDLATMNCRKIFPSIPDDPPLKKYQAVMLAYNKSLLLHGGRPVRKRTDFCSNEMHQFNPLNNTWNKFTTWNVGPRLSDHCGVIQSNNLILYGGYTENQDVSTCFHILNFKSELWCSATLRNVPTHFTSADYSRLQFSPHLFPPYQPGTYSLISLKPGFLLLFGEPDLQYLSYNFALLIEFPSYEPCTIPWSWRVIQITGKFEDFTFDSPGILPFLSGNTRHPKVVAIQSKTAVKLVSLGLPRNPSKVKVVEDVYYEVAEVSKRKHSRIQNFLISLSEKMLRDLMEVYSSSKRRSPHFYFAFDGISLKFKNFLVNIEKLKRTRKFPIYDVQIRLDLLHQTKTGVAFDLVDLYEIRRMISEQAERLHLNRQRGYCMQADPGFYGTAKLVTYSAIIDTSGDFQNFFEINLKEGEPDSLSSPALFRYEMCPTEFDIVVLGGSHFKEKLNESGLPVTGYIYTMTPSFPRCVKPAGSEFI